MSSMQLSKCSLITICDLTTHSKSYRPSVCNERQEVVNTNLLGTMFGSRAAMRVMQQQQRGGKIFLMDGAGARGNATPNNVAYGATKRGLTQLKVASNQDWPASAPFQIWLVPVE